MDQATSSNPLKQWLEKHDISYEELARQLEMSLNTVSRYCRGLMRPSDDAKIKIAAVTRSIERERKLPEPRGVVPADWFSDGGTKKR